MYDLTPIAVQQMFTLLFTPRLSSSQEPLMSKYHVWNTKDYSYILPKNVDKGHY